MLRVKISRWINHRLLGGNPQEMVSSRVYRENRYGWMLYIDWWFYTLRGERRHCKRSHIWEKRYGKTKPEKETQMSQDWEQSFLPFGEGGLPPDEVSCDQCRKRGSLTLDMIEVKKQTNSEPINLRFCSEHCSNEWYLNYLRRNSQC